MEKNFAVGQSNELVWDGRTFDIHNWYDFAGFGVFTTGHVQLWFSPCSESEGGKAFLVLDVLDVQIMDVSSGLLLGAIRDVDEIGYKEPEDRDLDWLVAEPKAKQGDHLVFRFGASDYIRLYGRRADISLRENAGVGC